MSEVIDAEVVEGTDLAPLPATQPTALFRTDDPAQVLVKATEVADALADVIQRKRLFVKVQGKSHVLVEGWQLLGSMLGVTAICTHTEPVEAGYKATVEARTADGRVIGRADALCTKDEKRGPWKSADDYARLSMAQTRATSKALKGPLGFVVSLAGYEATPAEEMTFAEQERPPPPEPPPANTNTISASTARMLQGTAKASGVPTADILAWLDQHRVAGMSNLTPKLAEEFSLWLEQQSSDVPAETDGLPA
jgi:hypothetical protein